jgi:dimethylglycine dehydrogenase
MLAEQQRGVKKRFVTLTLDAPGPADAPYMSTIWQDGVIVGETTSGAWGYRIGKSVALGMLRPDLCVPGDKVEVEIFGERFAATVQPDAPIWDPKNDRIRA